MRILLPLVFLAACNAVPHEVVVANAVERQAAQALAKDEANIIKGYDKEIRRMATVLLDAQRQAKIQAASIAAIPSADLARIEFEANTRVMAGASPVENATIRAKALAVAGSQQAIPLTVLAAIDAECAVTKAEILAQWETKREEFLQAPNRDVLLKMNDAVGRYLGHLESVANELQSIVGVAKEIK